MKKGRNKKFSGALWLLSLAASLFVLLPNVVGAGGGTTTCTGDTDCDGFSDSLENSGIPMKDGTTYPGYLSRGNLPRNQYLDPSTKDLFVIMVPLSSGSLIPQNSTATVATGLGITVHEISPSKAYNPTTRQVTSASPQLAVKITEDNSTDLQDNSSPPKWQPFGASSWGTPNGQDDARIYTYRIQAYVKTVACPSSVPDNKCVVVSCSTANCTDAPLPCNNTLNPALCKDTVVSTHIRNTIPHEVGHEVQLATKYSTSNGGYHYATGSNTVMEQSVAYKTDANGVVTFYIPTAYASGDSTSTKLK